MYFKVVGFISSYCTGSCR